MGLGLALLSTYVGAALLLSFLCSLLEATLLSIRVSELVGRKNSGERGAAILLDIKQNRLDDAISAVLTLNTIAQTIGAALAGAQAAVVFGDAWVGVFSGVLTLLVLVLSELIPKTLGTSHASRLVGFVGRALRVYMAVLAPLLFMTRLLTKLFTRETKKPISRAELAALLGIATREGTLRRDESRLFDNVLRLEEVTVADVMTPRTVAMMLPATTSIADFLVHPSIDIFSRIPLYGENRDEIVGYIVQRDVLAALARGADPHEPLSYFKRDVWFIPENVSLGSALRQFLQRREHMAIVADEFGSVSGLVTFEDLIETILGAEILDESDRVVDMRALAIQLRDRRMRRTTDKLESADGPNDTDDSSTDGTSPVEQADRR